MANNLDLALRLSVAQTGLANITALIEELTAAGEETTQFEQDAERLRQEITQLGQQQGAIDAFKRIKQATEDSSTALAAAQAEAQRLGRAYSQMAAPTAAQTRELQRARDAVNAASQAHQANVLALQNQRAALAQAGLSTTQLAQHQIDLNAQSAALTAEQARLEAALQAAAAASTQAANAAANSASGYTQAAQGVRSISTQLDNAQKALVAFVAGGAALNAAQAIGAIADEYKNLEARIGIALDGQGDVAAAMQTVRDTANATGQSLSAVGELYTGLARSTALSQSELAKLVETVSQATALSGGSAESASAAITQLNQALAAGAFRGDEFNSVMEQAPIIGDALATSLGKTRGELRQMAEDGQLTTAVVTKALLSQSEAMQQSFGNMPLTIGKATERIKNEWMVFVGELDKTTGTSAQVSQALGGMVNSFSSLLTVLNNNLDTTIKVGSMIGETMAVAFGAIAVASVGNYARSLVAATAAAGGLRAAIGSIPTVLKIGLVFAGLDILKQVAFELGELAGKYSETGRSAEAAAAKQKQAYVEQRAAALASMDALEQTKNTTILTAQQFARLGEDGKAAYLQNINGALEYNKAALKAAYASAEIGEKTKVSAVEAAQGLAQMKAALAQAEQGAKLTAKEIEAMLSLKAENLLAEFAALEVKAGEAAKAVGQIAESLNFKNTTDVQAFGQLLDELKTKGKLSAEEVKTAWQDALKAMSGEELGQFALTLQAAFTDSERDARAFAVGLETSLNQAFQNLGLEASQALGQIDQASRDAAGSVDFIRTSLEIMSDTGINKMQALEQAISAAIGKQNTAEGLDKFAQSLEDMGKKGEISADGLKRLQDQLRNQRVEIEKTIPGMQSLLEMYDKFGIVSQESLNKAAKEAKELYEATLKAGKPAFELNQAYEKFAEATLKAAEAQGDWQKSQAQTMLEGLVKTDENRAALNKLTGAHQQVAAAAQQSGQVAVQSANSAIQATERQIKTVEDLEQSYIDAGDSAQEAARKAYVEGNLRGLPSGKDSGGSPTTVINNYNNSTPGATSTVSSTWEQYAIKAGIAAEDMAKYSKELAEAFSATATPEAIAASYQRGRSLDPAIQEALKNAVLAAQTNENAARLAAERAESEASRAQSQAERAPSAGISPPSVTNKAEKFEFVNHNTFNISGADLNDPKTVDKFARLLMDKQAQLAKRGYKPGGLN